MAQEGTFGRLLYAVHIDDQGLERDVYVKTVSGISHCIQYLDEIEMKKLLLIEQIKHRASSYR